MESGNSAACLEAICPFASRLRELYNLPEEGKSRITAATRVTCAWLPCKAAVC